MKKGSIVQIFGMMIVFAGLVLSMVYFDGTQVTSIVASIITILAAVAGVIGFWYQMKQDADSNQAQFIIELQKNMIEFGLIDIKNKLYKSDKEEDFTTEDYRWISNYITFFENMAPMIFDGVLTFDLIDDLFSFNFFLAANHPVAQSKRLVPYTEGWCGFVRLHKEWTAYKRAHKKFILKEETSLEKVLPNYEFFATPILKKKLKKRDRRLANA